MNIRLVLDFETGRPKGFAFVEYEDAATALSAIRNLNGYECNGRPVRLTKSHHSTKNTATNTPLLFFAKRTATVCSMSWEI